MSDKRYEANIIRATAVEPANNLEVTSAPGVWSLDEVMELQKKNKWPTVGNVTTDVTDVFSTFLYEGDGTPQSINNGVDLSGEGGLVWIKVRTDSGNHVLYDTERGATKGLYSNDTSGEVTRSGGLTSFNSNGFSVGNFFWENGTTPSDDFVSWTFRQAPKFFDIVTYTGNNGTQTINHNLGSVPGMIIVKRLNDAGHWGVKHRSIPATKGMFLNQTAATYTNSTYWGDTEPTSTQFTVSLTNSVDSAPYVAYLFAHNDGDGEFGPGQDEDIIKCGSFSHNFNGAEVNLGFEPQWILLKAKDQTNNWYIFDAMRGIVTGGLSGDGDAGLIANSSNAENVTTWGVDLTSTGFIVYGNNILSSGDAVYMAIRRGPLAAPTDATKVFFVDSGTAANNVLSTGFNPDMSIVGRTTGGSKYVGARLTGSSAYLFTDSTAAEASYPGWTWDESNQFKQGMYNANNVSWTWKRAPSYFDVVAYTGDGNAGRTVAHNLGVAPEMIWIKGRTLYGWVVYHKAIGNSKIINLNDSYFAYTQANFNNTDPTSSVFTLGSIAGTNGSNKTFIAYLFATVAGVSKVGSYTGSSSGVVTVDCGFTSGARFVLIKRTDASGDWYVYDSVRGINSSADDPYLLLNTTDAESTNTNNIEPHSSGFQLTQQGSNPISINGGSYIFYAIA